MGDDDATFRPFDHDDDLALAAAARLAAQMFLDAKGYLNAAATVHMLADRLIAADEWITHAVCGSCGEDVRPR